MTSVPTRGIQSFKGGGRSRWLALVTRCARLRLLSRRLLPNAEKNSRHSSSMGVQYPKVAAVAHLCAGSRTCNRTTRCRPLRITYGNPPPPRAAAIRGLCRGYQCILLAIDASTTGRCLGINLHKYREIASKNPRMLFAILLPWGAP